MTLRTPRRRISPRTKRRYRAIREFFKRALGSSQQEIQINSSIAVNVTDLKHKIVGIEHQLDEVSKHCRDLVCLESNIRKETELLPKEENRDTISTVKAQTESSTERKSKFSDTQFLYRNSHRRSDDSDYASNTALDDCKIQKINSPREMNSGHYNARHTKVKNKKSSSEKKMECECHPKLRKHKARSNFETFTSGCSTSSFHSLIQSRMNHCREPEYSSHRHKNHSRRQNMLQNPLFEGSTNNYRQSKRKSQSPARHQDKHRGNQKSKHNSSKLDEHFIADIIRRQYRPVKLFGRRQSDLSQFSAPVCRDQEYSIQDNILEGSELCSCCYDDHNRSKYVRNNDLSDMRSICDTRLYSSKRNTRNKHYRRQVDVYNDSNLYDLIPVKEKSSPKSRRKFVEDNMLPYDYYKEVPPSPRTLRPRLNLKAQYNIESDDYMMHVEHPYRRHLPVNQKRHEYIDNLDSDMTSVIMQSRLRKDKHRHKKLTKIQNATQIQQDMGTMSSLQYANFANNQVNNTVNDITLNKTQDTDDTSTDKTDKALCEIKNILQNFLQEIKKDTSPSYSTKSVTPKATEKQLNDQSDCAKVTAGLSNLNFNNYSGPPCLNPSFIPPFTNPCCYPLMPVCPMNCMQTGYVMPSPSFSYHGCTNTQTQLNKETVCQECSKNKNDIANETLDNTIKSNETDELIKEIYKYVAQSPNAIRKKNLEKDYDNSSRRGDVTDRKVLTSRSVGGSSRATRNDANVGTPTMKCYSKSCEAIGSRMVSENSRTNPTRSDTVLEKLSLEATTHSLSDSDDNSDTTIVEKKKNKFAKVLQSFGFFKKKKKETSEELSETESTTEVEIRPKNGPYKQHITNYMMHGQEYYRPPPVQSFQRPDSPYGYPPPGYDPRMPYNYPMQPPDAYPHTVHHETIHEHAASHYNTRRSPRAASPYSRSFDPHYAHTQPQVPLCLKEIEVKSTGTQSERKISFFRKLAQKPSPRVTVRTDPRNCSTQTAPPKKGFLNKETLKKAFPSENTGLLAGLKKLQSKLDEDPMSFNYKTHKNLAEGDLKMRNAVLKKLFYKRNPFSPRNLIVRTILGKDKSSFGEPQMVFRPKMFF